MVIVLALLLGLTGAVTPATGVLSDADVRAIRATLEAYRVAWLHNDRDAVLATFAPDAVIMPHNGGTPSVGIEAIRRYWFSPGPVTTITVFELSADEVYGSGEIAFVRGRSAVRWTVEAPAGRQRWSNAGTFLTVMVKTRDGIWKMRVQMWDDPPNQREPE
jgi:uncharacterized protein (TIGR02246 family)